CQQHNGYLPTF
nr:immunoglobulin light chain junction region [Macaca mulatta]MOV79698.1 immunoglobulin light chain junction region [Macaca mulatta]